LIKAVISYENMVTTIDPVLSATSEVKTKRLIVLYIFLQW